MAKVPPFSELIAATTRSAVHLELRDTYSPDDQRFIDWQAGRLVQVPASPQWWSELVRASTARGVSFRRARIVSEPLSDYIRFEHFITASNIAIGEQVRWLPRKLARGLCVPVNDFWVFDDQFVRLGYFAGDGTYLGDEVTDDPETVRTCGEAFEAVWEIAIPHADYRPV